MQTTLDRDGFAVVPAVATANEIADLIAALEQADLARVERAGQTFGARNLLDLPSVRAMATSTAFIRLLMPLLGSGYRAVRGLFFDKTPEANWPVLWHQDLSLAIAERRELSGWENWSIKRGVLHVQPPAAILARMLTVRVHLDDCPKENGPLRVIAGSHTDGILSRPAIQARTRASGSQTVTTSAGDALLMRPLLLHASSPAVCPGHRRVLHLEFAPANLLPNGLRWAAEV